MIHQKIKERIVDMRHHSWMKRYFILRKGGYRRVWTGNGRICLVKEQQ